MFGVLIRENRAVFGEHRRGEPIESDEKLTLTAREMRGELFDLETAVNHYVCDNMTVNIT